ncbi:Clavaminate synthase-like protein [Polychaeton citri CBS 116435]|uniref:Clavaminate synthase-like protein n=1 Tax=Polychaeton citri CBS 116435 TaxID=1314669 RepID=A0A9P4Q4B6_9PEZI|nr:Clavaminate synthase-like protein [Polychaeton citri CBS 116435]
MQPSSVTTAVSADSLSIPLIDFDAFLHGDESTRRATAQAILSGFQNAGFIYLSNHGITPATVRTTFAESAKFFARPQVQKDALAWTTPEANRGYSGAGREKTTDLVDAGDIAAKRAVEGADLKESLEIGREGVEGMPNQWPGDRGFTGDEEDAKGFRDRMLDFFEQCKQLHMQVMGAIAVGMGIGGDWFDGYCDGGDNTLRLLHYPEVRAEVFKQNKNQVRAGAHTDYGSITLLFQDMRGGLQVLSPNGNFIDAKPIEGAIVVNAGDLLARWSNDVIKSTKHRVVEPPGKEGEETHPARYSIAYFCNPNAESWIDAIPGTFEEGEDGRGKGKNGEYLVRRLQATY